MSSDQLELYLASVSLSRPPFLPDQASSWSRFWRCACWRFSNSLSSSLAHSSWGLFWRVVLVAAGVTYACAQRESAVLFQRALGEHNLAYKRSELELARHIFPFNKEYKRAEGMLVRGEGR